MNALQLQSLVSQDGALRLSLEEIRLANPTADDVVIRVEATPMNPSDLVVLLAGCDVDRAIFSGSGERPLVTAPIPHEKLPSLSPRIDIPLFTGNEGAGVVVSAGSSAEAQDLIGRTVAFFGNPMHRTHKVARAQDCLVFDAGTSPREAASAFINPLTAQAMIETMHREGHKALVHTAAASNLGFMLNRLCLRDGIALVNVVRRREQALALKAEGALHVCVSSDADFEGQLADAIATTGATVAFDAVGGGTLANQILAAMDAALKRGTTEYRFYGSTDHKQLYIYGSLDASPTLLAREFGMIWGVGGWLLTKFLASAAPEVVSRLRRRVATEVKTTFASNYSVEVSLHAALGAEAFVNYARQGTGQKVLINPSLKP